MSYTRASPMQDGPAAGPPPPPHGPFGPAHGKLAFSEQEGVSCRTCRNSSFDSASGNRRPTSCTRTKPCTEFDGPCRPSRHTVVAHKLAPTGAH